MSGPRREHAGTSAVEVRHLSKRFGRLAALDDVSFRVGDGEALILWGPNGAGKTTLLRCLLGVVPFTGTVRVQGWDVRTHGKAARGRIGYVPQEIRFHGDQTVAETAVFYAALRRVPSARADALLDDWGLRAAAGQPVRTLSGGMKQKLALVIALLSDPPILLLDEPTSNLDVQARREFSVLLEHLKQMGKTLLFCSHRIGEVWKLADRVVVLRAGRAEAEGPPAAVAGQLQEPVVLCVTVPRDRTTEAAQLLTGEGFRVERNGMQLWVGVSGERKTRPIQLLLEAQIPLLDFELGQGD